MISGLILVVDDRPTNGNKINPGRLGAKEPVFFTKRRVVADRNRVLAKNPVSQTQFLTTRASRTEYYTSFPNLSLP